MTFQQLQKTPGFEKLTFEEQQKARALWVQENVLSDSKFQNFSEEEKLKVVRGLVESAPVFEHDDENARLALELGQRLDMKDPEAVKEAKTRIGWSQATKGSLVANAIMGVVDVFDGPDRATYEMTYGRDSRKAQQWLFGKLDTRDKYDLQEKINVGAFTVNALEALLLNVGLVGTVGKAGLLTKGLLGPGGRVASWAATLPHGLSYALASELGEQAVQAGLSAIITTASRTSLAYLQDPEYKTSLGELAKEVGQDLVADWVAWAGFSAMFLGAKALKYAVKGYGAAVDEVKRMASELPPDQFQQTFLKKILTDNAFAEEMKKALTPENYALVDAYSKGELVRLATKDLSTPEGMVKLAGKAAGFDVKKENGKFQVNPIEALEKPYTRTFEDPREALRFIRENANKKIDPVSMGGVDRAEVRVSTTYQLPKSLDFNSDRAANLLLPSKGNLYSKNAEFVAKDLLITSGMDAEAVKNIKFVSDPDYFRKPWRVADQLRQGELRVPESVDTPMEFETFRARLVDQIQKLGNQGTNTLKLYDSLDKLTRSLDSISRRGELNFSTLKYVGEVHLGVKITDLGGGQVKVGDQVFRNWTDANRFIMKSMIERPPEMGGFSLDELKQIVKERTGGSLELRTGIVDAETGFKQDRYELRNAQGLLLEQGRTPSEVLAKRPDVFDALVYPASYGPKVMVIDPDARTVRFDNTVAYGTIRDLSEMGNRFKSIKQYKKLVIGGEKVELEPVEGFWSVRIPETGAEKTFVSGDKLKNYLKNEAKTWEGMQAELYRRGFNSFTDASGAVVAFDVDGKSFMISSPEEFQDFLKNHPIPESVTELVEMDAEIVSELDRQVAKTLRELDMRNAKVEKSPAKQAGRAASNLFGTIFLPTESQLARLGEQLNAPEIPAAWRELRRMQKFVNQRNKLANATIEGIWGKASRLEKTRAQTLLAQPEDSWDMFAQKVWKWNLTPQYKEKLLKSRAYYDQMFKAAGLPESKKLTQYTAQVRNYVAQKQAEHAVLPARTSSLLREVFGPDVPQELSFFGELLRRDSFIELISEPDVSVAMMSWANALHKKTFLGSSLKTIEKGFEAIRKGESRGLIPPNVAKYFTDSVLEFFGATTTTGKSLQEFSLKLTNSLAEVTKKVPIMKEWGLDRSIVTDDIIGKLNTLFTYSTQSYRMWAVPRNLMQINLLSAYMGSKEPWSAFAYVLENPKYIEKLLREGWISETLYTLGTENAQPLKSFWASGLQPLENTEVITRATAYRAAEQVFDKAFERLNKGVIDGAGFAKELSLDMLDREMYGTFMKAVREGQTGVAKRILGDHLQDSTMFIYGKGQGGTATRGVIGRLFGKLGVYPLGTVDLYRKMLTRGSPASVAARTLRFAALSTATYWIFNEAGIDYQGFLWTDPFKFAGGPMYSLGNDILNAFGDGPEASLARANLKRALPNSFIPGYSLSKKWMEGIQAALDGDYLQAMHAMSAAPSDNQFGAVRQFTLLGYKYK